MNKFGLLESLVPLERSCFGVQARITGRDIFPMKRVRHMNRDIPTCWQGNKHQRTMSPGLLRFTGANVPRFGELLFENSIANTLSGRQSWFWYPAVNRTRASAS